jgi:hypothetical protein
MAGLSSTRQNRNKAISGVGQLYNMPSDVQTQRAGIFFATGLSFRNALRGICGMVSLCCVN